MSDASLSEVLVGISRMGQPSSIPPIKKSTYADSAYDAIVQQINDFQNSLDSEHEVSMEIASFGQNHSMSVTDIGYANPHMIVFYGLIDGRQARFVQNISQVSFLLVSKEKPDPKAKPFKVGFVPSTQQCEY